jgi:hypothetical protein
MRAAPPSFRLFAPRFARTVHLEIRGLSPDSAVSPTDKATVVVSLRPTGPRLRSTSTSPSDPSLACRGRDLAISWGSHRNCDTVARASP